MSAIPLHHHMSPLYATLYGRLTHPRWGSQPWMSEYTEDGTLLWAARYPESVQSYRALRSNWTGQPSFPPSLAIDPNSTSTSSDAGNNTDTVRVYMSWNGATQVASYNLYHAANEADDRGTRVAQGIRKAGFETQGEVQMEDGWFGANDVWMWVKAVNAQGEEIGRASEKVKVSRSDAGLSAEGGSKGGESEQGGDNAASMSGNGAAGGQGNGASLLGKSAPSVVFGAGMLGMLVAFM